MDLEKIISKFEKTDNIEKELNIITQYQIKLMIL